ncbi:tRNA lysidine(34) synthetase TilS [Hyphomicrobium sp.]|jgi:tRNA(Ile)-lysidine synthase|uniref:tRNA lysidine(34) synthetase TilS n=1 Tax=Hyphomicrobium sp. TaxID=82 RepID=UPI002B8E8EF8|nr:tRNA lysidine(34) synthetase TilS [Hyphomicrobium sp.]HVZ04667.1 tRNA lysidine(34) synthetase TilS [Hyphomicrobium sp.]
MAAQSPVAPNEADSAFEHFTSFDHIVLAVSGGPDSMALLVLAAEWRARKGELTPSISVVTVDHGLRKEAAAEVDFVRSEAQRLGLQHTTLHWLGDKPATGIPDAARTARYRLLEKYAESLGAKKVAIVTAHHQGDQAETFAMRLARGSGVSGLAAMRAERPLFEGSPVRLVRPLLDVPKSRLISTLEERHVRFVEDPTNCDQRYERARIRKHRPALDSAGLTASAMATSARRLADAEAGLRYAESRFTDSLGLSFGNEVFASFDRRAFDDGPPILRQRLLSRLIARYGGKSPRPELSEVEDLTARLHKETSSTVTLGGVMISSGNRFVRLWREAGRLDEHDVELAPGESRAWDERFLVHWTPETSGIVIVRPLGSRPYSEIAGRLAPDRRPPSRASHALPSFWIGEDLVAVPSLAPFAVDRQRPFVEAGCSLKVLALSAAY